MKKYFFSVVEYGIMNDKYKGYRGARIEVEDNYSGSPFPVIYEASILIPEEFYDRFVEVFDGQESDLMPRIIWDHKREIIPLKDSDRMDLNFIELTKDWEEDFYEGNWESGTLKYTETEKRIVDELKEFLPRHMYYYDWNLPYVDEIVLIFRRHLNPNNIIHDHVSEVEKGGEKLMDKESMTIKTAREFISNNLREDEGFRLGYRANIAMLIHDDQTSSEAPTNLSTVEGCNFIADRIINLIFS